MPLPCFSSTRSASCWAGSRLDRDRVVGVHAVGREHDGVARLERDRAHADLREVVADHPAEDDRRVVAGVRARRPRAGSAPRRCRRPSTAIVRASRSNHASVMTAPRVLPQLLVAALEQQLGRVVDALAQDRGGRLGRRRRRRRRGRGRRSRRRARPARTARRPRGRPSDPRLHAPAPPRRARVPAARCSSCRARVRPRPHHERDLRPLSRSRFDLEIVDQPPRARAGPAPARRRSCSRPAARARGSRCPGPRRARSPGCPCGRRRRGRRSAAPRRAWRRW